MVEEYQKKHKGKKCYIFESGDPVAVRKVRPGKLRDEAEPGYIFLRYIDETLGTCQVMKGTRVLEYNSMDLIPLARPELSLMKKVESSHVFTIGVWNVAS